jgi:uncharacterized protein YndB with AHSA1/START domain
MNTLTVEVLVARDKEVVWNAWTLPEDIQNWNHASDDWECPYAENNPVTGGKFLARMSAKDGSMSFDFNGVYTKVVPQEVIEYTLEGGRKVQVLFRSYEDGTMVTETFDPEQENTLELQKNGWQSILDNFKQYVEKK